MSWHEDGPTNIWRAAQAVGKAAVGLISQIRGAKKMRFGEGGNDTYFLNGILEMREGASEEFPECRSRDSTLPLSTVYLFLIMTGEDKLYQLTTTQNVVHQERPIADPDVLSRVVDVGALLTQETTCFLVWLKCAYCPPATVPRRGS